MTAEEEQEIRTYLKGRFRGYRDEMSADESLEYVVDSIGLFELVEFVEKRFNVHVPNEKFHPGLFSTISRIGDLLEEFSHT